MPRGDRTGPQGYGPMTGRGAGYCSGYGVPGYANAGYGWSCGFGGGGRGWRHGFYATGQPGWARGYAPGPPAWGYAGPAPYADFTPEREVEALRQQSEYFQKQMDVLNARIRELEELDARKRKSGQEG
jgi:hypothetical protein